MRHPTNRAIYDYWNDLRGARRVPDRLDIDPGQIAPHLERTFLLETGSNGGAVFRLAGSAICAEFGAELRGRDFVSLWQARDADALAGLIVEAVATAHVAVVDADAVTRHGERVGFEFVLLPLARSGTIDRFLGAAAADHRVDWPAAGTVRICRLARRSLIAPDRFGRLPAPITQNAVPAPRPEPVAPTATLPLRIARDARRTFRVLDGGLAHQPRPEKT